MQIAPTTITERRGIASLAIRALVVGGCALFVCACNTDQQVAAGPDVPSDYRLRHPITVTEADHTIEVFIGSNRGEINAVQRAQVMQFAQTWKHEATGGVIVDLPVGTSNERAAAEAMPTIRSLLTAGGVPPNGLLVRAYNPPAINLATIRITYPRLAAQAGPCGVWPEDIGPSFNRAYSENQPMWNAGCATQRNLAAMVEKPADLAQPRAETPAYEMRRTAVMEQYRQGQRTQTQYPAEDSTKISNVSSTGQ